MRRGWAATAAATLAILTACQSQGGATSSGTVATDDPSGVSGDITVLTNRTDQVSDGTLKKYADAFRRTYPKVKVTFEGITDYEGEVKSRMQGEGYGDVLLIPNSMSIDRFPDYFEPLGVATELSKKFDFTEYSTVDNRVYGIANIGIATGIVYNRKVWEKAGVTEWPATPQQFLDDLQAVKDRTDATPYYTNYKDAWPLRQWADVVGAPNCMNTARDAMATTSDPWHPGQDLYTVDSLLYDIVHRQLAENDPTDTDWETSKTLLGTGKVGSMLLGSWALPQMQKAAKDAGSDPDDIGYMPFPTQVNSHFCTVVQPDYKYAVNVHSEHKEAARAWIDWYITASGSAAADQSISTVRGTPLPSALQPFEEKAVRMVALTQDNSAVISAIDKQAEIGLSSPEYRQKLIDIARGAAPGDMDDYFSDLNRKWSAARRTTGG